MCPVLRFFAIDDKTFDCLLRHSMPLRQRSCPGWEKCVATGLFYYAQMVKFLMKNWIFIHISVSLHTHNIIFSR